MGNKNYYKVPIYGLSEDKCAYFYETDDGKFCALFGHPSKLNISSTLKKAVKKFMKNLQNDLSKINENIKISYGSPIQVSEQEINRIRETLLSRN